MSENPADTVKGPSPVKRIEMPNRSSNFKSIGAAYMTGNFFGAWKALNQPDGLPEAERETPIKEVGETRWTSYISLIE